MPHRKQMFDAVHLVLPLSNSQSLSIPGASLKPRVDFAYRLFQFDLLGVPKSFDFSRRTLGNAPLSRRRLVESLLA